MSKRKIFFRADAGLSIGYGHFIRTLALADMLKDDFDCTFFTQTPTDYQKSEAAKVCQLVSLPSDDSKFDEFLNHLRGDEIVVLDNYFYTSDYQKQIKDKGCKLVCVDDMHDRHYYADAVINHALTDVSLFDIEPYTKLCLGLQWALLRKPFLQKNKIEKVQSHWFISFGGSDANNLTGRFLSYLQDNDKVEGITVVIGDAYQHKECITKSNKTTILKNLSAEEMAYQMSKAEYAVLPNSGVCIEALACGCKIAAGYYVDNQIPSSEDWKKRHYILSLGNLNEYHDDGFINQLIDFVPNHHIDFSNIPNRYAELFKSL